VRLVTTPAANKESGDISWILMRGLIGLALVALVARFGRKLALAGASVMAGRGASPPPDRPASPSPTAEPANASADERKEAVEGIGRDEAVGYIKPADPRIGWLDARWQITAMDAICEQLGLRLVLVAHDGGNAAGTRPDRPGLKHALERLAASDRGCLIVPELRALGDSVAELGRVLGPLRDRGVRLVAVDAGLDTAAEDGVLAATAVTSRGGAEDGRGGRPRRATRVPSARELGGPAVRDIPGLQERITMMRSAGMTLQAIADRLNRDRVPTVRGGREWRPSSVQVAAGDRPPRRLSLRHRVGVWDRWRSNNR